MNTNITKTMPQVTGDSMISLGRRAFFNKTYNSHLSSLENRDYSSIKGKQSSMIHAKP